MGSGQLKWLSQKQQERRDENYLVDFIDATPDDNQDGVRCSMSSKDEVWFSFYLNVHIIYCIYTEGCIN